MAEILDTPGPPFGLARTRDDAVWALIQTDSTDQGPELSLARLDGDRFVVTGAAIGSARRTDFIRGPDGPWLQAGTTAQRVDGRDLRDVGNLVEGERRVRVAVAGDATIVASIAGIRAGDPGIARVRRVDPGGVIGWTVELAPGLLAFGGVVEMSAARGWRTEPKPAWRPERWSPYGRGVLATGDLIVASFYDPSSGIGMRYGLAVEDGRVCWQTIPAPLGDTTVFARGEVAIGSQGYDAFETQLRGRGATPSATWPSHGPGVAIDDTAVVIEMDNAAVGRCRLVRWHRDGRIERGDPLPGYYSTRPAVITGGDIVFARAGALWRGDRSLRIHHLAALGAERDSYTGPTIITGSGDALVVAGDRVVRVSGVVD